MAKTIKIKCNGPEKHVNEIDLEQLLRRETVVRGTGTDHSPKIPEKLVVRCKYCPAGRIILTRQIIEENL